MSKITELLNKKQMKNLLLTFVAVCLLTACNTPSGEPATDQNTTENDTLKIKKSYTGEPLNRFDQAIENMEQEDATRSKRENEVLFIGSSSIRFWTSLAIDFDPIPVINRGFGGSTLPEVYHYADRIILPYHPKLIVLYCGENDIAEKASPTQAFDAFKKLDQLIEEKLPDTKLIYIAMKPSIARWNLWEQYQAGDRMIHDYIKTKNNRYFVDCGPLMLNASGQPDSSIFVEDMLHLNEKGYAAWTSLLKPEVEKRYAELTETMSSH